MPGPCTHHDHGNHDGRDADEVQLPREEVIDLLVAVLLEGGWGGTASGRSGVQALRPPQSRSTGLLRKEHGEARPLQRDVTSAWSLSGYLTPRFKTDARWDVAGAWSSAQAAEPQADGAGPGARQRPATPRGPTCQRPPEPPGSLVHPRTRPAPCTLKKLLMMVLPEGHRLFLSMEVVSADSVLEPQQLSCGDQDPWVSPAPLCAGDPWVHGQGHTTWGNRPGETPWPNGLTWLTVGP